jgi:hypothetical protein
MTKYLHRDYLGATFNLFESRVKVSYQPATINQSVSSNSKEYITPYYSTPEEAFIHAKGWVDCMKYYSLCSELPKDNEDLYKEVYEKLLESLENERFEQDINNSSASKEARELAYHQGWTSKLEELNSMEIRNPE